MRRFLFPAPRLPQAARVGPPLPIQLYLCRARAGFPSPADDYVEDVLELNDLIIHNRDATFFARAEGDSMTGAGIRSGDLRRELEAL